MSPGPPLGLYLHIPFCEAKCTYCHFAIDPGRPRSERQERYGPTLYLGGGTPSLMSLDWIERLVESARDRYSLAGAEVTLEANPKDSDREGY